MTFKIGKTCFKISYPLAAVMTVVIILDTSMTVLVCFLAALLHECGHLIALGYSHSFPDEIRLSLFDIAIVDRKKFTRNITSELVITLAGVTVNLGLALLSFGLYQWTALSFFQTFLTANLCLGVFNALPVSTLDGGQALSLLLSKHFSPLVSERIVDGISFAVLIPTACVGFWILLVSKYNFSLLLAALYLLAVLLFKTERRHKHRT